jgi:hypothetical protein
MTKTLLYKEFRETLPIAVIGLACLMLVALDAMGYSPVPGLIASRIMGAIPFALFDTFASTFTMGAGLLALALGFWHSLGDFWGEAHLFLLHRPVRRTQAIAVKLAVGLVAYLLCGALPILMYALWAATPGTHASPFEWSMTVPVWLTWLATATLYLGAFLSGIRPAAWIGTRLAPLAAAAAIVAFLQVISMLPSGQSMLLWPLLAIAAAVGFVTAILSTAATRDFA